MSFKPVNWKTSSSGIALIHTDWSKILISSMSSKSSLPIGTPDKVYDNPPPPSHILLKYVYVFNLGAVKFDYIHYKYMHMIVQFTCTHTSVDVYHTSTGLQIIYTCTFNGDNTVVTEIQYSQTQCCTDSFDINNVVTRQRKLKTANSIKLEDSVIHLIIKCLYIDLTAMSFYSIGICFNHL